MKPPSFGSASCILCELHSPPGAVFVPVLLIAHKHEDREVCFFAVHNQDGWVDLHGQELTVLKGYKGGVG